jgi:hypothetical protein
MRRGPNEQDLIRGNVLVRLNPDDYVYSANLIAAYNTAVRAIVLG